MLAAAQQQGDGEGCVWKIVGLASGTAACVAVNTEGEASDSELRKPACGERVCGRLCVCTSLTDLNRDLARDHHIDYL